MIDLNNMNVEINVGAECMSYIGSVTQSGTESTHPKKRRTCIKQSSVKNKQAQVILTRAGKKPMAIAKEGTRIVVPVRAGNIVAQSTMKENDLMVINCTVVGAVDDQCLLLSDADDAFGVIEMHVDEIKAACYTVMRGEDFAYFKSKR